MWDVRKKSSQEVLQGFWTEQLEKKELSFAETRKSRSAEKAGVALDMLSLRAFRYQSGNAK